MRCAIILSLLVATMQLGLASSCPGRDSVCQAYANYDEVSKPLQGVMIVVQGAGQRLYAGTDKQGRFVFDGLTAGEYGRSSPASRTTVRRAARQ